MARTKKKIVIIGIGNLIRRDDGIGIHVIRALQQIKKPINLDLQIIDGGLEPDLSVLIEGPADKLVIIDAVQGLGIPGTIKRLPVDAVENSGYNVRSAHFLNMQQSLKMLELLGNTPRQIVVIGVEPADMDPGTELSHVVADKLPEIINAVRLEIMS